MVECNLYLVSTKTEHRVSVFSHQENIICMQMLLQHKYRPGVCCVTGFNVTGEKKHMARPGLEPRTSRTPFEHSDH